MKANDLDLLRQYAAEKSEEAFTALVNRHLNLVYSSALRQVRSPQLAEEVAQSVFSDLARSAAKLKSDTILSAWLYEVARRTAIDLARKEARRQLRERVALEMTAMNSNVSDWTQVEPLLDEAMAALEASDRAAILLRYFENKSLRDVGQTLGTTDDAAQKRVSRAIERLRDFFARRGVSVAAGGLAAVISGNAVQAAPAGLAASITAAALSGATITTAAVIAATKTIAMTTLQKTIVASAVAVLVGAGVYEARQASNLHAEFQTFKEQQAEQTRQLTRERDEATNLVAGSQEAVERPNHNTSELLRLRGVVTALRNRTNALEKLLASLPGGSQSSASPQETASQESFPRGSWKFLGYATPQASFQSMMFALSTGDAKGILDSYVPEVRTQQEKEFANTPETVLRDRLIHSTIDVTGFRIVRTDVVSDDEAFLTISTEGTRGSEGKFCLQRIQNEWKIDPRRFDPGTGQYK